MKANKNNYSRCILRLWAVFSVLLSVAPLNAHQVAIFDFDDRLKEQRSVARYIEEQLRNAVPEARILQFSGKGDEVKSIQVLRTLDQAGYDLIITITSDALILAKHLLTKTPVLYTNVNNPLLLGFDTLGPPGDNISGASYYVPIKNQMELYKKILPDLASVGLIFDRYNKSRKVELPEARDACNRIGLQHEIEIVEKKDDLAPSVQRLLGKGVGAIIAATSDKVYDRIHLFLEDCNSAGVPIFSFNRAGVQQGAVAALAGDYYRMVDQLLIPMALKVLKEKISPGTMPAAFLKENIVYLNRGQIQRLKLEIPEEIAKKATFLQ